ncbi:MAG: DUF4198 domain-containing protein [Desulfofustis sp.]|nr:DUF4198 domain-containing protein [Desulfofustis sp.]
MRQKSNLSILIPAVLLITLAVPWQAHSHFGMVIPSVPVLSEQNRPVDVALSFSHPFEFIGMELDIPKRFFMVSSGQQTDLLDSLQPANIMGSRGYTYRFTPSRPGVYQFVMEPQPYWEPLENRFIIHYTKTVVSIFEAEDGWQEPVGLPVEIRPLLRPFGNYRGNSFVGQVLVNGKAAAHAEVEVEYYDKDQRFQAPTGPHITQMVIADANGIFTFSCPLGGWWGFASLSLADYKIPGPKGDDKEVELGAVLWIFMDEYQRR